MNTVSLQRLIIDNPGADAAAILALAQADKRTVNPIPLADLRALLAGYGILGNLALAAQSNATAANANAYVLSANQTIRSDLAQYASQLDAMLTGLAGVGVTSDVAAQVIALGGGYQVADAAADDVAAVLSGLANDAIYGPREGVIRDGYNAAIALNDRKWSGIGSQVASDDEAAAILALKNLLDGGL